MLFFTEIFHLLVEQTNVYYQQHLDRQAGPSRRLPDITLPDMMTFVVLALQMEHELKERAQSISAPDVKWACAWCLVLRNITQT